jgi:NitT/TauT family transport system ATP-binding protein
VTGEPDAFRDEAPALSVRGLKVSFSLREQELVALEGLDLAVANQEFVALVGPSGCGKSTLLKALGGMVPIAAGEVTIPSARSSRQSPTVATVFQEPRLLPWRTVLDNVAYPLEAQSVSKSERRSRAMIEIKRVGLGGFESAYPGQLSGGMQQRVNLARALVANPEILLLDEPFAALDAQLRNEMQKELLRVWETERKTALFVTHQVDEAVYLADRVVMFSGRPGRVKREWKIDLPRPRPLTIKRDAQFHAIEDEIWSEFEKTPAGRGEDLP